MHARLEEGEDLLDGADLLVNEQNSAVGELDLGGLGVSHEVRGDVSSIPLETFDVLDFSLETLALGNSDSSVGSEFVEDASDKATDVGVVVGRDGGDVSDLISALNGDGLVLESLDDLFDSHLDASAQVHWVHASGDRFAAFLEDGASENGGSGGTVAGLVVGLGGDLLDEVGSDVVEAVAELDVLGDGDTILGDLRHAESSVENDVPPTGTEGDLHSVSEHIAALEHESARISSEFDILTSEVEALGSDQL